ncbi:MAG: hypothetical protein ACYTFV_05005 [Planctomycetota bacterium]|jgi:rubrerythrin
MESEGREDVALGPGSEAEPVVQGLPAATTAADSLDRLGPLVRDMRIALRSEFGAYSLYLLLPLIARNDELRKLLIQLRDEQRELIQEVRALIEELGGAPAPRSRWTRAVAAWALFLVTPVCGMRLPLRLCCEAERTVSRWYGEYAMYLVGQGRNGEAIRCQELEMAKRIHATRLSAFVSHLGGE